MNNRKLSEQAKASGLENGADQILKYGFPYFAGFMHDFIEKTKSEMEGILRGPGLRELWQTFMTGNYYYCFECQSQCPAMHLPQKIDKS